MKRIEVVAGAAQYDVLVGPLAEARPRISHDLILVSEPRVFGLHGARVGALLGTFGAGEVLGG